MSGYAVVPFCVQTNGLPLASTGAHAASSSRNRMRMKQTNATRFLRNCSHTKSQYPRNVSSACTSPGATIWIASPGGSMPAAGSRGGRCVSATSSLPLIRNARIDQHIQNVGKEEADHDEDR